MGELGKIRRREATQRFYLDFRPYGRVWSNRGIPIADEGTAKRLFEHITTFHGLVPAARQAEE